MHIAELRDSAKAALRWSGLFPFARTVYRNFSPSVQRQQAIETSFYSGILKRGDLCFDIGANLGQKSEIFLSCGARTVIIEPNPLCAPTLNYLFKHNREAVVVPKAVGATSGVLKLHVHGTDSTASVRADWDKQVFGVDRNSKPLEVPVTTLDELVCAFGTPQFVKIDVEGYELEVLSGLSARVPVVSFEYNRRELSRLERCVDLLSQHSPVRVRLTDPYCNWVNSPADYGDAFVWSE